MQYTVIAADINRNTVKLLVTITVHSIRYDLAALTL
jgi:hypothetical protein